MRRRNDRISLWLRRDRPRLVRGVRNVGQPRAETTVYDKSRPRPVFVINRGLGGVQHALWRSAVRRISIDRRVGRRLGRRRALPQAEVIPPAFQEAHTRQPGPDPFSEQTPVTAYVALVASRHLSPLGQGGAPRSRWTHSGYPRPWPTTLLADRSPHYPQQAKLSPYNFSPPNCTSVSVADPWSESLFWFATVGLVAGRTDGHEVDDPGHP